MKLLNVIKKFEKNRQKNLDLALDIGNRVRIGILIQEADKKRVQYFEGIIIAKNKSTIDSTITVRRIFQGIGVEKIFPIYSPQIKSILVLNSSKVRRSKLFYLRNKIGKAAFPIQNRISNKVSPKLK